MAKKKTQPPGRTVEDKVAGGGILVKPKQPRKAEKPRAEPVSPKSSSVEE